MDLETLLEILVGKDAKVSFDRGRRIYSVEMTTEEVIKIFGEAPPSGTTVGLKAKPIQDGDGQHLAVVRRLQSLPGGKDKPLEE
ncbi:MAG: hypothetical protein ACYC6G_09155 [Desulfobaccales bacterium]